MKVFEYKGYEGSVEVSTEDLVLFGKVLFVDDLVTYEAENVRELEAAFKDAVDDYIETSAREGRSPKKPFKGTFNVRVSPALHRAARLRAIADGENLNKVVTRALMEYLHVDVAV